MRNDSPGTGVLWQRSLGRGTPAPETAVQAEASESNALRGSDAQRFAVAGLCAFTLLLYIRPNELLPGLIGGLPLAKIVAIPTLIAFVVTRLSKGQQLTVWPREMKMLAVIVILGVALVPLAYNRQRSIETLTDTFFKVITVFVLMVNLLDTHAKLRSLMKLVVLCGTFIGLGAIRGFVLGHLDPNHLRLSTGGDSIYTNVNELAMALDLMLPFAVAFALTARGASRFLYSVAAAIQTAGIVLTFSRGGFLGLIALGGVLLWKAGRGRRVVAIFAALLLGACFAVTVPAGYTDRLFTIVHIQDDPTNSAQQRRELLDRAFDVALRHPIVGVGIGNYPEYSIQGKAAHNSYLEIAAELGWLGLAAYLVFIFSPVPALRRIERNLLPIASKFSRESAANREIYFLSIALQAVIVAYLVCSFFSSSQYFWHLYYVIAYAVSLRATYAAQSRTGEARLSSTDELAGPGVIWGGR